MKEKPQYGRFGANKIYHYRDIVNSNYYIV